MNYYGKGNMMSVREDVVVLDATLRDGGLVNDFYFTDDFVRDLYKTNLEAGVDYMEFGYRADKKQFDVNKFGKWNAEICEAQNPKRNAARIARRKSIHPSYGYLV